MGQQRSKNCGCQMSYIIGLHKFFSCTSAFWDFLGTWNCCYTSKDNWNGKGPPVTVVLMHTRGSFIFLSCTLYDIFHVQEFPCCLSSNTSHISHLPACLPVLRIFCSLPFICITLILVSTSNLIWQELLLYCNGLT